MWLRTPVLGNIMHMGKNPNRILRINCFADMMMNMIDIISQRLEDAWC